MSTGAGPQLQHSPECAREKRMQRKIHNASAHIHSSITHKVFVLCQVFLHAYPLPLEGWAPWLLTLPVRHIPKRLTVPTLHFNPHQVNLWNVMTTPFTIARVPQLCNARWLPKHGKEVVLDENPRLKICLKPLPHLRNLGLLNPIHNCCV